MTAVLGVTVAIGLAALVLLILLVRRSAAAANELSRSERLEGEVARAAAQLRAAEGRAEEEARRRTEAADAAATADEVLRQARAETEAAERRADESQQRAEQALRDVEEAERRAADADKRAARAGRRGKKTADAPQQEAEPGGSGVGAVADVADALWELERLRLEREWNAIGGLAMPMPAGWDGADGTDLSAAVAVELEVIREVVGTPGRIATPAQPVTADPATAIIVTRLAGELLRALARGGLELSVSIEADDDLAIAVATAAAETADDLSRLATAASHAGGTLDVQPVDEGVRVEVRLPR
jgi:flagellar biosynthesis GTPase FlhF